MPELSGTTRRKFNNALSPSTWVTILAITNENPYTTVHIGDTISDANGAWNIDTGANEGPFIQIQWKKEGNQIIPAVCNPYITSPGPIASLADLRIWAKSDESLYDTRVVGPDTFIERIYSVTTLPGLLATTEATEVNQAKLVGGLISTVDAPGYYQYPAPAAGGISHRAATDKYTIGYKLPQWNTNSYGFGILLCMNNVGERFEIRTQDTTTAIGVSIGGTLRATRTGLTAGQAVWGVVTVDRVAGKAWIIMNGTQFFGADDLGIDISDYIIDEPASAGLGVFARAGGGDSLPLRGTAAEWFAAQSAVDIPTLISLHDYLAIT